MDPVLNPSISGTDMLSSHSTPLPSSGAPAPSAGPQVVVTPEVLYNELASHHQQILQQGEALRNQQTIISDLTRELRTLFNPVAAGPSNPTPSLLSLTQTWEDIKSHLNALRSSTAAVSSADSSPPHPVSRLPPGFKTPKLEPFGGKKGEDLTAWLFQAEEQFSLLNITDDDLRIRIAGMAFRGAANTWYHSVRADTLPEAERLSQWGPFKASLIEQFSPVDPVKVARDQLADLHQEGSVREYTSMFRHLCTSIKDISEAEKLDRYVRGLKPHTKRKVELREPPVRTFAEASKIAERVDNNLVRIFPGSQQSGISIPVSGPVPMELGMMARYNSDEDDPCSQIEPQGRLTTEEREHRKAHGLCFYCGSDQHLRRGCDVKPIKGT